ncbi:MAG: sigma-54 interaction domain-containing protein [Deltaproteobacteria bacterium]
MTRTSFIPNAWLNPIENVLDSFDGAIVIDKTGKVVIITEKYADLAGLNKADVLGSQINEYFPTSRMMEVVRTGKPILADLWEVNGVTVFVSRMPLTWNGQIVGAFGVSVFRYVNEAKDFAQRLNNLDLELQYYKTQVRKLSGARYSFDAIVGSSPAISEAKNYAMQVARTRATVLLVGETGTGKELFAHAIHQESPRRERPFVRVNCAGIPENLAESELFGYEDGAFTGARKGGKPGKFEIAHGGTIFLDEINELPYHVQAKLLRVLSDGEIERVGSTEINLIDTRIISATNIDLRLAVQNNLFRQDLFYRLNVNIIRIPSLRERRGDIPLLCDYFLDQCNEELGTDISGLEDDVLDFFNNYDWPGNVRELKNTIERMCIQARRGPLQVSYLPRTILRASGELLPQVNLSWEAQMNAAEKDLLLKALQITHGNRTQAARLLGIHRTSLYSKMKKHKLLDFPG